METLLQVTEVSKLEGITLKNSTIKKIENLQKENFSFLVEQLTWKDNYSQGDAEYIVGEYQKWITFLLISKDDYFCQTYFNRNQVNVAMPSKHIDNVWHRHILFTKEYQEFCERVNGVMLHHRPCTKTNIAKMDSKPTIFMYEKLFGVLPTLWLEKEDFLKGDQNSLCQDGCNSHCDGDHH